MTFLFCVMGGPLYVYLFKLVFHIFMFMEITWNLRDPIKDEIIGYNQQILFEWTIFIATTLGLLSKIVLPDYVMMNSEMGPGTVFEPLFYLLTEYDTELVLFFGTFIFMWFIISLRRGSTRYQY